MGLRKSDSGIYYNLKIKDQTKPSFQQIGKNEDGDWEVVASEREYAGLLQNVKVDTYEHKKETKYKLVMEFLDSDTQEKEFVSCNFNSLALSIINTFANEDSLVGREIVFKVYTKTDGDGEDRPRIYIEIDGEKAGWKVDGAGIGKIYKDHRKWIALFDKHVKPVIESFVPVDTEEDFPVIEEDDTPQSPGPVEEKKKEEPVGVEEFGDEEFDDLPF